MTFNAEKLLDREFPTIRQTYTEKDCMLYALGVGMGIDPLDEACLRFVYEEDLKVLPSQSVMMAHPGFWAKEEDIDLDWVQVLHAGQEIIFHNPLPTGCINNSELSYRWRGAKTYFCKSSNYNS